MNNHYEPITMEDISDAETLLYIVRLALGVVLLCMLGVASVVGFL